MKFLVLWSLEIELLSPQMMSAVLKQQEHATKLQNDGKLIHRYHVVGRHGGAWIYDVSSNEELDRLLASSPVFNYAHYEVLPLADAGERLGGGRSAPEGLRTAEHHPLPGLLTP